MNKSFQRNPLKETHNAVIENRVADVTEAFQLNPFRAAYKMQVQAYYKYLPEPSRQHFKIIYEG